MFKIIVTALTILFANQTQANETWDVNLRCFLPNPNTNAELSDVYISFNTEKKTVRFDPNIIGNQTFSENLVIQWGDPVISWVSFGLEAFDLKKGEMFQRTDVLSIAMFNRNTSKLMHYELYESNFEPFINKMRVMVEMQNYLDNGENGSLKTCVTEAPKF